MAVLALESTSHHEPVHGAQRRRFDSVLRLAQRLFDMPMVAVDLIGQDEQVTIAALGLPEGASVISQEDSFCAHAIASGEALVVPDARADQRFAGLPSVVGEPFIRSYVGQPLRGPDGSHIGAVSLLSDGPCEVPPTGLAMLRDIADWVEKELFLDSEVEQAAVVQQRLLPKRPPALLGLEVAGSCRPARDVGGDFYDWFSCEGMVQVALADVMGKGMGAGIVAASVRAALRAASPAHDIANAVTRVGTSLETDLVESSTFVTLFTARIDSDTGDVTYVDAGHGLGVVLSADGGVRRLTTGDLPVGALPGWRWTSGSTVLEPGERLIVVSDGYVDPFQHPGEALEVLLPHLNPHATAAETVDIIMRLAEDYEVGDDMTVLVVRRTDG